MGRTGRVKISNNCANLIILGSQRSQLFSVVCIRLPLDSGMMTLNMTLLIFQNKFSK